MANEIVENHMNINKEIDKLELSSNQKLDEQIAKNAAEKAELIEQY